MYVCDEPWCDAEFKSQSNLLRHQAVYHNRTPSTPKPKAPRLAGWIVACECGHVEPMAGEESAAQRMYEHTMMAHDRRPTEGERTPQWTESVS